MLKKLYKHELYSLFRTLWPGCLGFLLVAIFARVSFLFPEGTNPILDGAKLGIMVIYILSCAALFVLTLVVIITRFYKHLLTSEGYLSFTLPISATAHLTCKLVCGMLAMVTSVISFLVSLMIFSIGTSIVPDFFMELFRTFAVLSAEFSVGLVVLYTVGIFVLILLAGITALLMIYAAISVGQQFKSRIGGAVLTFGGFYIASQMIVMTTLAPFLISTSQNIFDESILTTSSLLQDGFSLFGGMMLILIVVYLIFSSLYFLLSRYMLSKKLNLE